MHPLWVGPASPPPQQGLEGLGEGALYCACLAARDASRTSDGEARMPNLRHRPPAPAVARAPPVPYLLRRVGGPPIGSWGPSRITPPRPPIWSARPVSHLHRDKQPSATSPRFGRWASGVPARPDHPTPRNPDFCLACASPGIQVPGFIPAPLQSRLSIPAPSSPSFQSPPSVDPQLSLSTPPRSP